MKFHRHLLLASASFAFMASTATAAIVDGVLYGNDGATIAHADIALQDGDGKIVQTVKTDDAGRYSFHDITAGSYVVLATRSQSVLGSMPVSVLNGHDLGKDLKLSDQSALNIVIAHKQAAARNAISTHGGTSSYKIDQAAIEDLPQGGDTSLNKVLLQSPGVAEDSAASGNLHIRGEHANVQYRINGIMLPEGINGFGDVLDPHIMDRANLLDGILPAQYGLHTAAVLDIDTKSGFAPGGTASMTMGSNGLIQPSVSYGNRFDAADYFVSATHVSTDLGIENPTASAKVIHDHSEQDRQFAYVSALINPYQRLDLLAGNSINSYEIPNNPNQSPSYTLNGVSNFDSAHLNERQRESNQFAALAWQGSADAVTLQVSPYFRQSETHFTPDVTGDLLFNGVSTDTRRSDLAVGLQNDTSWRVNERHTLRAGMMAQNDTVKNNSTSYAFLTDDDGNARTDANGNNILSSAIINNHGRDGQLYGLYAQDEWKLSNVVTLYYGVRFDDMEQYVSANQLSPRVNVVYQATPSTTLHAGYARYFTPPPMELVSSGDISAFANTTNAAEVQQNSAVKPERSHNFDIGVSQQLGAHWQVGWDNYAKLVHDMLDEGQFGAAYILTPFNYQHGYVYGSELTAHYTSDRLRGYVNFAASRAMGENIVSSQFNFGKDELDYIANHYVHLDHDQTYTASAGASYDLTPKTSASIDGRYGSGLRRGFANTQSLSDYITFDLGIQQKLDLFLHDETSARFSIVNILDSTYELRDGSGIGIGAPQWGARRGFYAALAQKF